jgi:hypothetical protein
MRVVAILYKDIILTLLPNNKYWYKYEIRRFGEGQFYAGDFRQSKSGNTISSGRVTYSYQVAELGQGAIL